MEAYTFMKMVEYAFCPCFFIIYVIISDDYRTIKSMIKHTSSTSQVQVMKSSKINTDE